MESEKINGSCNISVTKNSGRLKKLERVDYKAMAGNGRGEKKSGPNGGGKGDKKGEDGGQRGGKNPQASSRISPANPNEKGKENARAGHHSTGVVKRETDKMK